jgi:hypothetical protein
MMSEISMKEKNIVEKELLILKQHIEYQQRMKILSTVSGACRVKLFKATDK